MDIGNAIKILRKEKQINQKKLAALSEISVNALCQIENNAAFPQKSTIQRICDALEIPTSYLLLFSISEEDVPKEKRLAFNSLNKAMKSVLIDSLDEE